MASTWVGSADAVFRYRPKDHSTVVYEIRPDSASAEAGLKPGDRLLAIDGKDITNAAYEIIRDALRGPVGSFVLLTIERGSKILDIKVERRPIREEENEQRSSIQQQSEK